MTAKKRAAKKTATKRVTKKAVAAKPKKPTTPVQAALQTTFVLKGTLKRVQLMYLRVCVLLAEVRDKRMYEVLKHPDMESYARERLGLGRSSLYNYLKIHEWVKRSHPEWLEPKPKGFIPDFADVRDLMWIETELTDAGLTPARRKALEELRTKGLAGQLTSGDLQKVRRSDNTVKGGLKQVISSLRAVRKRAAALANMSPEALEHMDAAIQILTNDDALKVAGLDVLPARMEKWHQTNVA